MRPVQVDTFVAANRLLGADAEVYREADGAFL